MSGWGRDFFDITPDWSGGVHDAASPEMVPEDCVTRALNAEWVEVGDGSTRIRKRTGMLLYSLANIPSDPIIGQHVYRKDDGDGTVTVTHLILAGDANGGEFFTLATSGTCSSTLGVTIPSVLGFSSVSADNRVYATVGTDCQFKSTSITGSIIAYDGSGFRKAGIDAPSDNELSAESTGSGVMTGTFHVAMGYANSTSGHQSSRNLYTEVICTSQTISLGWSWPTDEQVDRVKIHLRNTAISVDFYEAATVSYPTTSTTIDISDNTYNGLTTLSPDQDENDPPPQGIRCLAWWRNRLWGATSGTIYYSKDGYPEAFDPESYELINPDDGETIQWIGALYDKLIILKDASLWAIVGSSPLDWSVELIARDCGCIAPRSVVQAANTLFWWGEHGPVAWAGEGAPQKMGIPRIWNLIAGLSPSVTLQEGITAGVDRKGQRVLWAVPSSTATAGNDLILPFNYRAGVFEGEYYAPLCASWGEGDFDTTLTPEGNEVAQPWLLLGGQSGKLFLWNGQNSGIDGVPSGTYSGSDTATASTLSLLTGTGIDTTIGLTGLRAWLQDGTGEMYGPSVVSTNGSTTVTVSPAFSGLTTSSTYTWYVGAYPFELETRWYEVGPDRSRAPFHKKRLEFAYVQATPSTSQTLGVEIQTDLVGSRARYQALSLTGTTEGQTFRVRVAKVAKSWRLKLRQMAPTALLTLMKVGMRGELLTDKK